MPCAYFAVDLPLRYSEALSNLRVGEVVSALEHQNGSPTYWQRVQGIRYTATLLNGLGDRIGMLTLITSGTFTALLSMVVGPSRVTGASLACDLHLLADKSTDEHTETVVKQLNQRRR
jgi:hypothetical protein